MRGNPSLYTLTAEPTLAATLTLLAQGQHTPFAGGTELMVAFAAGRLAHRPLVSIHHLQELRYIHVTASHITIGSGSTFTEIRHHPAIAQDLPLLTQAASWTGAIANQNRATLGGNLVNASPAADTPPALLCYEATLNLISAAGTRTLAYTDFHLAYKQTALCPGELIESVTIPRAFANYQPFIRKVGTRNAQAISKLALASLIRMNGPLIQDVRIAAASLSPVPMRLRAAEAALLGQPIVPETIHAALAALISEITPIDDIRSSAGYRIAVAGNVLRELLTHLV